MIQDFDDVEKGSYVSTGHLLSAEQITGLVEEAYEHFKSNARGANSNVYPALERVPSHLLEYVSHRQPEVFIRLGTRNTSSRS